MGFGGHFPDDTVCISITINSPTPASMKRCKGLACWQFAYLVANPSPSAS